MKKCSFLECTNNVKNLRNKYCSSSCAAKMNNIGKRRHGNAPQKHRCSYCLCEFQVPASRNPKYCSSKCNGLALQKRTEIKIENGKYKGGSRDVLKRYLIKKYGHKCVKCNLSEWMDKKIPLELDHIDGNASNNKFENLQIVCPTCHALTTTWKGKNKGSGRKSRGLPLY